MLIRSDSFIGLHTCQFLFIYGRDRSGSRLSQCLDHRYKLCHSDVDAVVFVFVGVAKAGDDVVASVDGGCSVLSAAPPVGTVYSP